MTESDVTKLRPFPFRTIERTPGLHLSEILQLMRTEWLGERFRNPEEMFDDERERQRMIFEQGFIWEDALSIAFGWPFVPQWKDVELDGIMLNPDKRFNISDDLFVDEYKFTSKSVKQTPMLIRPWMWQNMAYAYALSTPERVYGGRFYVLYINGDYRDRMPMYRCYEYTYSYQELYENWQSIRNFAAARGLIELEDDK